MPLFHAGVLMQLVLGVQNQLQMSYSPISESSLLQEVCLLLELLSGFHYSCLTFLLIFPQCFKNIIKCWMLGLKSIFKAVNVV